MGTPHVYFADAMLQYDDDALLQRRNQNAKESSLSPSSISPTPRYERNMGFFQQLSRRFGLRSNDDLVYAAEDDTHSSSTDSCSSAAGAMPSMPMQSSTSMSSPSCTSRTSSNSNSHAASVIAKDVHDSSLEHISCASSETSSIDEHQQHQQQQQQQQQPEQSPPPNVNTAAKERKSATRSSFSRLHRRSTSSIRRAFESFSLSSRSLSCSGATPPLQRSADANAVHSSNGSTPIKSALKSTSNVELHKKSAVGTSSSSLTSSSSSSSSKCTKSKTKPPPQRILRQPVSYTYLKGISGLPTQRVPRSSVCCQYARR